LPPSARACLSSVAKRVRRHGPEGHGHRRAGNFGADGGFRREGRVGRRTRDIRRWVAVARIEPGRNDLGVNGINYRQSVNPNMLLVMMIETSRAANA
jgi:hypothetical protein